MRLPGSATVLETRRRKALALIKQGLSLNAAARRIGCAASSVMRWVRAFRHGGPEGLKVRRASGRPPRLSARQRQGLLKQLLRGPMAHGYPTELWTTRRIAEVIERRYGVRYPGTMSGGCWLNMAGAARSRSAALANGTSQRSRAGSAAPGRG